MSPTSSWTCSVAFRRIMALNIDLANALAERVVDEVDAALPAVALDRNVGDRLAVKIETRIVERFGQGLGVVADEVEGRDSPSRSDSGSDETSLRDAIRSRSVRAQ